MKTDTKKKLALTAAAALMGTLPVAAAPAAHAAYSSCAVTYVCLFEHDDYLGRKLSFYDWSQTYNLTDWGFNDQTSSWHNNQESDAHWFDDIWLRGNAHCMQAWSAATSVGWWDNDKASSLIIDTDAYAC